MCIRDSLYWMTIEFGLVDTPTGRRIYGGGILSSPKEAVYCLSNEPEHQAFDPLEAMRTPYRIDILQPLYFVLPDLQSLFALAQQDIMSMVREAMALSGVEPSAVRGLGFDATCSLVVVGPGGKGLPVGPSEDAARDIIVWMDHRALEQAARINATGHKVLRYVGGVISPEMETPKLLWLKENRPAVFADAEHFFDLADYLLSLIHI